MYITINRRRNLDEHALRSMHILRAKIFRQKKEWDVSVIADMEIDGYDALDPYYMIITDSDEEQDVCGCWRILPTTGPNMLAHTFPELLSGMPAPCSKEVWELSRFAIESRDEQAFGFSPSTTMAIHEIVRFALSKNVKEFVTVTTVGVEKMLRRLALDVSRFGPPQQIGVERAVALRIHLSEKTTQALETAVGGRLQSKD